MIASRALIALAILAAPPIAAAAPPAQAVTVQAGDLDLASSKGQRILAQRIARAARALCTTEAVDRLPQNLRAERACIREARASAAAAVRALTIAAKESSRAAAAESL